MFGIDFHEQYYTAVEHYFIIFVDDQCKEKNFLRLMNAGLFPFFFVLRLLWQKKSIVPV